MNLNKNKQRVRDENCYFFELNIIYIAAILFFMALNELDLNVKK